MPKFMIERNVEGVGKLSDADFKEAAKKSCDVIREMGPEVQWIESYVTDDKFYCVYLAPDERSIRDHAMRAGFPADAVNKVARMVDPVTAEA
jgi:hypothetical protein